jgi:aspartate racemase
VSSLEYYRVINEEIKSSLGGLHSAEIVMVSVDFEPIEKLQYDENWELTEKILSDAAKKVELAGADFLLICTNTMHKFAPQIE